MGEPSPQQKPLASWYAQGLSDGLGDRLLMFDNSTAPSLELLRVRPDLATAPGFEAALRERVQRLGQFRHPAFARVRAVTHLEADDSLALVSNYTPGKRLSEVLQRARGPRFAAALIRQLTPALVLLQQHGAGMAHGALGVDRIIVTPEGRLTIVEHVLGSAIETLRLSPRQLAALGIPVPPSPGERGPRLDVAADLFQLGLVAVSVLVGRRLDAAEHPQVESLLDQFAHSARRDGSAGSPVLRRWLERALQIDGEKFESGGDAREALGELLEEDHRGDTSRVGYSTHPVDPSRSVSTPDTDRPGAVSAAAQELRTVFDYQPAEPFHEPAPTRTPPIAARDSGRDRTRPARSPDRVAPDRLADDRPGRRAAVRSQTFRTAVSALVLLSAAECGVIAGLVYRGWLTPQPPLVVEKSESGANVLVGGGSADTTPLRLTVASDMRWIRVVSPTAPAQAPGGDARSRPVGGIQISSPIELQVFEAGRLLGSVPGARVDVSPGQHDIQIVNLALGYRLRQAVNVDAGQTVSIYVAPPDGSVTLDAAPGAEVSIDGKSVGRTPLVGLSVEIGEHEFTFRHPQLGEDRQKAVVKSDTVTRVTANLHR